MARVFVAMSGGVDSSVAAALLLEQGHEVTGVTMQLWESGEHSTGCCSVSAVRDAKRVCDLLGIAHYTLNYRETFEREVVGPFARDYAAGRTPNPCVVCNDRVKFADLLAKVSLQGADFLATGHYARIFAGPDAGPSLARGLDPGKDQSYFLYRLTASQMEHVLFPVGELHKADVRAMAERFGLHVADKADSQETCFAADGDYIPIVSKRAPEGLVPGAIVDASGRVVGSHRGVAHFTIGQRKGIGAVGQGAPRYVVGIDADNARVVVGDRTEMQTCVVGATSVVWHGEREQAVQAVVRYRMEPREARATFDGSELRVQLAEPLEGVAQGQSVVCYSQDRVVGGGVIEWTD